MLAPERSVPCFRVIPIRQAGRVLAYAGQRQVAFDGVLRGKGAPLGFGQVHVPADDQPQPPGRADLQNFCQLQNR